jgi:hypothetical protein
MLERRIEELEARLARAESELAAARRRSKRARWLLVATAVAGVGYIASLPRALQAQVATAMTAVGGGVRFKGPLTVLDAQRRPIAQIADTALGRGLVLFDTGGHVIAGIGTTPEGRGIRVFDAQDRVIAGVGEGNSISGTTGRGIVTVDTAGKIVTTLGTGTNGAATGRGLTVNDAAGIPVFGAGVWPQAPDRGQLVITNSAQQTLFAQPPLP